MSDLRNWPEGEDHGLAGALEDARERLPDDVTMRRMWARVAEPELLVPPVDVPMPRARTPRWFWFAGGVALSTSAALAIAFFTWHGPQREVARLAAAPPAPVAVAPTPSATTLPAPPEGTVRTGAGERLQLALEGGAEARLGSSSALTIGRDGHAAVDGGEVAFTVVRRERVHPYVVTAGPYRVVVMAARFTLSVDDARRVRVDAHDGSAEVWDQGRVARLGPGDSWTSPATQAAPAPHARAVAIASPDAGDPEARAQAALASGDVGRALAIYRALAKQGGPAGENAAYEVGKLLRDRMGQPTAAVTAWRRYRADHPDGILRVETDVSIIETLVHAGDTGGALVEASAFLRDHADSERRAEIARVAGDLYRVRGDLERAVAAYDASLAAAKPNQPAHEAEAATFHRAECLVQLGDARGDEAARAYLHRWPDGRYRADAERLLAGPAAKDEDGAAARL
ncbi:MAG TPA: FecR family protein [Polyangia bacterium]|nr:FecR family protein [Polyangia bacterium]